MESTPFISPALDLFVFLLALILFFGWIVRRRKNRRREIEAKKLEKRPYTTSQIFGIIGILIFILPIFWAVVVMLQKGLFLLFILLFGWIESQLVNIVIKTIFLVFTSFFMFLGVYLICELMWPKRYLEKIKSAAKEGDEQKQVSK